jgi:ATP-dependent RNA helicase DOB1
VPIRLKEELAQPLRVLQETARRIAKVSTESGIALVEEEYVQTFKVEMMDVVMQWCKGVKFADICKVSHTCCSLISWPRVLLGYGIGRRELTHNS